MRSSSSGHSEKFCIADSEKFFPGHSEKLFLKGHRRGESSSEVTNMVNVVEVPQRSQTWSMWWKFFRGHKHGHTETVLCSGLRKRS